MARSDARRSPSRTRRPQSRPAVNPHLYLDLVGIALFLVAGLLMLELVKPGAAGVFGWAFKLVLQLFVGQVAYAGPLILVLAALALITGRHRVVYVSGWLGAVGLLIVTVAGLHLYQWPHGGAYDSTAARVGALLGRTVEQTLVDSADGGLLGAVTTTLLYPLGLWGSCLALVALGSASAILLGDVTLMSLGHALQERSREIRRRRREHRKARAEEQAARRAERQPALLLDFPEEPEPTPALTEPIKPAPARQPKSAPADVDEPRLEIQHPDYTLPSTELLAAPEARPAQLAREAQANIQVIEQTLAQFRIEAQVVQVSDGPSVTRYEVRLGEGIRVRKILDLADNLAMSLAAMSVRVEAPIPGKAAIGIEVPKKKAHLVTLRECLEDPAYTHARGKLPFVLGKDVAGRVRCADLAEMPHLLVAGATNSGKSVCLNSLIASLLYRTNPDELKMILVDPKRVELSLFEGIPHLCHPVIRDVKQAAGILRWMLKEMDRRYDLFNQLRTRNIEGYNRKIGDDAEKRLPFLMVVIDELADLMMQQGAEVEQSICRLAQLARATGIHLVIATQRPSVDVITGLIKANIPSRIAFAVTSYIDSRTIIDHKGAEKLVGRGDMLFKPVDAAKPIRVQGAFISEDEVDRLVGYLKSQGKPHFVAQSIGEDHGEYGRENQQEVEDELFEPTARFLVSGGHASTSMIQRRFKIGYTRAARLVDMMEAKGIVGPLDGAKPREILMSIGTLDEMFRKQRGYLNRQEETAEDPFATPEAPAPEATLEATAAADETPPAAMDAEAEEQPLLTPLEYDDEDEIVSELELEIPPKPTVTWVKPDKSPEAE